MWLLLSTVAWERLRIVLRKKRQAKATKLRMHYEGWSPTVSLFLFRRYVRVFMAVCRLAALPPILRPSPDSPVLQPRGSPATVQDGEEVLGHNDDPAKFCARFVDGVICFCPYCVVLDNAYISWLADCASNVVAASWQRARKQREGSVDTVAFLRPRQKSPRQELLPLRVVPSTFCRIQLSLIIHSGAAKRRNVSVEGDSSEKAGCFS